MTESVDTGKSPLHVVTRWSWTSFTSAHFAALRLHLLLGTWRILRYLCMFAGDPAVQYTTIIIYIQRSNHTQICSQCHRTSSINGTERGHDMMSEEDTPQAIFILQVASRALNKLPRKDMLLLMLMSHEHIWVYIHAASCAVHVYYIQ